MTGSRTLTSLRDMMPIRALSFAESLRLAELQATRLRELAKIETPPLPETVISQLPRIQVERIARTPMSGATQWSHGRWLIVLNGAESAVRQRFSLCHELKHIVDNPFIHVLYPKIGGMSGAERAEQVCDYFAGCLLIPRLWLKRAWVGGNQDTRSLARLFDVSQQAMRVRLLQIGLIEPAQRCLLAPPHSSRKDAEMTDNGGDRSDRRLPVTHPYTAMASRGFNAGSRIEKSA